MMLDPSAKSYNNHLCFPSLVNDHSESGVCSPTLWRTSPPKSPRHRPEDYWSLSPDSKAQAIARGQRELMEMVSKMPESCYELSMKDLVESKGNEENDVKVFDELPQRINKPSKVVRKVKSDKRIDPKRNSGGENNGFLLKMMIPVSLGDVTKKKKKKKKDGSSVTVKDSQVSPRTSISEAVKAEDKDWWNRLSDSTGSTSTKRSGSSRSNSSNRSRRSQRDEKSSCFSFLWSVHLRD